jgi:hypothetical protein
MNREKITLIAGCSHAAGAEIDGTEDSAYNRKNSFGNILSNKLNRKPINIASSGSTNPTIARSVIEWFSKEYNPDTMDLYVVIAWTESSRLELPVERVQWYEVSNPSIDWVSESSRPYLRINQGWTGADSWEKDLLPGYQKFIAENLIYLEITSANLALQLQYFLKMHGIDYLMCNTMHMFSNDIHLKFYLNNIDKTKYMSVNDESEDFYWSYRNAGYENPKAQYWHHNEIPHQLYADKLYRFINQ